MSNVNKKLLRGSLILVISFGIFNFFHFLFQFFMARMLNVAEYGVLAALFAIIYILSVFNESIQTIITKYSANEDSPGKLKNIFLKSSRKASSLSVILFLVYLIISIPLSYILKISYPLLFITGIIIFLTFFISISRGIMQGRKMFKSLAINMILESGGKLILGIILVYFGFKVYGAIIGVILGGFIAFGLSFFSLKEIFSANEKEAGISGIYEYAKPTFFITFVIVLFYSLDVVIAKIFFTPEIAGIYASASVLGKIIFWGTVPISKAMFPLSADSQKSKKELENIFLNSLSILLLCIAAGVAIFYYFSDKIILLFTGKPLLQAGTILFYLGIAFGMIAITNLLLLYRLSLNKFKRYDLLFIFPLIEIFLLCYFSKDLVQFSIAFITSSAIFLWGVIFLSKE